MKTICFSFFSTIGNIIFMINGDNDEIRTLLQKKYYQISYSTYNLNATVHTPSQRQPLYYLKKP